MTDEFKANVERYVHHEQGCGMLKPAPWLEPVMNGDRIVGLKPLSPVQRAEIERNRECSCGCEAFKASLLTGH